MKKTKIVYLTLGLGIGLVISNILYSIFPNFKYIDLSESDIIERAQELGYVSIKEKIKAEEDKEEPEKSVELSSEELDESKAEAKDIEIKILEGDTLKDITRKLLDLGLIENEEKFILAVEEKDMDKNFAYGKFYLPLDLDYSEIIRLLTR